MAEKDENGGTGKQKSDEDCLECRLLSGFGLLGSSAYVAYHARRQRHPTFAGQIFTAAVSSTLLVIGLARLFDVFPFGKRRSKRVDYR